MIRYPKYATTVIGAHSVPDWYEALDRLVAVGQLSMGAVTDAQYRATQAAVLDQELAGIDVITGGEMHRRTHNRHSPPNAMLNHFWQKIPAFQGATRPKPITPKDPDVFHPAATCRSRIADNIDLGLVDEFKTVSALTRKPVKITMTGPHMLATVAYDEHYNDIGRLMDDLSKLLRHNFKLLLDAGCNHIQIDEPMFTMSSEEEVTRAVQAINIAIEGLPAKMHVSTHICQGNYAVGKEYDAQIGHRYFDTGRYKADQICKIECSSYLVEYDMAQHYQGLFGEQQLGVGAVDVQDPKVESGEVVAARIRAQAWLHPEQTIVTSSCGFNHLPQKTAFGKLKAMSAAKILLLGKMTRGDDSEDLLALAEEAGGLGVFEWQVQAEVVRLSNKFLALYGLSSFDGRYQSWLDSVFREDQLNVGNIIDTAFAERAREFNAEFRITRMTDKALRWMEARAIVFYDADQKPARVVGVNVDVTDRKRALAQLRAFTETLEDRVRERTRELETENEARKKAEQSLRQAQKMEAVGQLTGGIAHDFNNLLTIVLGGLEAIGRQLPKLPASPEIDRMVRARDMAMQGVQRAATLTNRLLAFSRLQPLDPKPVDANKLVPEVCELLRRSLGEAVSLETVLAGGLWRANADPNQLENALVNLAVNARDAMPNGGKITIETANCYLDDAYVTALIEPVAPGQYIMIAVADTGHGMEKATLERAFEPFFTTKGVGKGTGLGLSQVYGFARQSSGHIRIYSEVGEGTTVKLYLPRRVGKDEADDYAEVKRDVTNAIGTECILLVEDDGALRIYTTEILTELGYLVLEAPNAASALDTLERTPAVDLLFTDIVMPGGMNGRQLADEARRMRPKLKVLFTTGYTRNAIVHHGRLDPGVDLITKPYSFEDLGRKVRAILDR